MTRNTETESVLAAIPVGFVLDIPAVGTDVNRPVVSDIELASPTDGMVDVM